MKVLILADPDSAHTVKWIRSLSLQGIEIFLFGLNDYNDKNYSDLINFHIFTSKVDKEIFSLPETAVSKLSYLKSLPKIKKIIKEYDPDILHAHYASSYGILAALVGFHPMIISVYGSDVFNFPNTSIFSSLIFKFNLSRADRILSTSNVMAEETKKYTSKKVEVIPFGIDLNSFKHLSEYNHPENIFVIGTVKALEAIYGIDYLIKAFKIILDKYSQIDVKLLVVGGGSQELKLKELCRELHIERNVEFAGRVSFEKLADYYNQMDTAVFLSKSESFGVSVLEASACELPVVVSNVGGLPEVVENNVTGFVVEKLNPEAAAEAIEKLLLEPGLRKQMGLNGRKRVEKFYNWDDNVNQMINIYSSLING